MKAGIVGSGFMGKQHLTSLQKCGVKEFCICDSNLENAKLLAESCNGVAYADFDEMLEKEALDMVSICVPTAFHNPFAIKALEKGVAVLCEKPFAPNEQLAQEIVDKAKETGTPLMVAHCLRFFKQYIYLKQALKDGRFGKLLTLDMHRHSTMPLWSAGSWLEQVQKSGGAVLDMQIHEIDFIISMLGKPQAITAQGDHMQCLTVYHFDDIDAAVSSHTSWRPQKNFPFTATFDAQFEKASVVFDGAKVTVYDAENTITDVMENEPFADYIFSDDPYDNEMRYFLDNLKEGKFPYCEADDAVYAIKTAKASLKSLKEKKIVTL